MKTAPTPQEESASVGAIDTAWNSPFRHVTTTITVPAPSTPRVLVTMHYPLEMGCVAAILKAVSHAYPRAVVAENGEILEYAALSGNPETESER